MIQFAEKEVMEFVEYLSKYRPTKNDVRLTVLHGFDSIGNGEEVLGFGTYSSEQKIIMVAGECPEEIAVAGGDGIKEWFLMETIAHEYYHHIQFSEGNGENTMSDEAELEAERFVEEVMNAFRLYQKGK